MCLKKKMFVKNHLKNLLGIVDQFVSILLFLKSLKV